MGLDYLNPEKRASAEMNEDFILVETYSGYRSFARDPQGVQFVFGKDVDAETLGAAVCESLAKSRFLSLDEVPAFFNLEQIKQRDASWVASLMQRFGYKTKRALFKNMLSCSISLTDAKIRIAPTRHDKLEGWETLKDGEVVVLGDAPRSEIGEALRVAFSRCR